MAHPSPLRVGIAIVRHEGCYLVGVRPAGKPLAGFSEFPGGKCEPGEASDHCAVRECREETGLEVVAGEHILQHQFRYAHGELDLGFWDCQIQPGTSHQPLHGFRWVEPRELFTLKFPEANAPLVAMLQQRERARSTLS